MKFHDVITLDKDRLVIRDIINGSNPLVFFGAANCAHSLYESLALHGKKPVAVAVDDKYFSSGEQFHGLPVRMLSDVATEINRFDLAIAIGTRLPDVASIKKHKAIDKVYSNIGFARGPVIDEVYAENKWNEYENFFDELADDLSRKTLIAYLQNKLYGDTSAIPKVKAYNQYFGLAFMPLGQNEILADCGAFTGDSIMLFNQAVGGQYSRIYAWEPDKGNISILNQTITRHGLRDVQVVPSCAYKSKGYLKFDSLGSATSFVTDTGGSTVACDMLDNVSSDASIIKMDVEGSEMEALEGAAKIIQRNKPKLAVAIYHHRDDMFRIPRFISSLRNDYSFYLLAHRDVADDVILYAV